MIHLRSLCHIMCPMRKQGSIFCSCPTILGAVIMWPDSAMLQQASPRWRPRRHSPLWYELRTLLKLSTPCIIIAGAPQVRACMHNMRLLRGWGGGGGLRFAMSRVCVRKLR